MKNKKLLSVLISICIVFSAVAGLNFTANASYKNGTCGDGLSWSLDADGVLTVSGEGQMADYSKDSPAPWKSNARKIKSVVFEDGVNYIGEYTFFECSYIENILFSETVQIISLNAFSGCGGITALEFPEGVMIVDENAFSNCADLEEATIPKSLILFGNNVFSDCPKLDTINYKGTKEEWQAIIFSEENEVIANATIYCTNGIINEKAEEPTTIPESTTTPVIEDNTSGTTLPNTSTTEPDVIVFTLPDWYYAWKYDSKTTTSTTKSTTTVAETQESTTLPIIKKPKKVTLSKVSSGKKQFKAKWKKMSGVTGYQVQYSLNKNFKKAKTVNIKGSKKTSTTIKKLKSKKKYYVRVRAYKKANGQKKVGSWSKTKTVKVK